MDELEGPCEGCLRLLGRVEPLRLLALRPRSNQQESPLDGMGVRHFPGAADVQHRRYLCQALGDRAPCLRGWLDFRQPRIDFRSLQMRPATDSLRPGS
jgi:hypothetical protein